MPRLSRLAPEDQPREFGIDGGENFKTPPLPGVNAATPPAPPVGEQDADPLAPPGYPGEMAEPGEPAEAGESMFPEAEAPTPEIDQDALMSQDVTDDEADQMIRLERALSEVLKDDEDPIPDGSVLTLPDADLLKLFEARLSKAVAFRAPFERRWLQGWLNYNQILSGEGAAWKSKVFLPLVFQQVTAALPPMVAAVYDSGPVWDARPTKSEHMPRARAVTGLLDWYMRDKIPSARRIRDLLWYSTLFGTGFMRVGWKRTIGTKRSFQPVHQQGDIPGTKGDFLATRMKVDQNQVLESVPSMEVIDIWDAFPAPHTKDDDYYPYFIEAVDLTNEELTAWSKSDFLGDDGEKRVKEWLESKPEEDFGASNGFLTATSKSEAWRQVGMAAQNAPSLGGDEDGDRTKTQVRVFVMWTNDEVIVASGDGTKILGKAQNPYWFHKVPIIAHHFERIPGCIYGRGIADIIEGLQAQANFNYNKGNDAVQLALNAPIAVRQAGNALVQGQVAWQPGAIIPCRDPGTDIKPLVVPDPMNAVFRLEDHLMLHADRSTGINDISRGMSPDGANTATEFAGLQSQVRIRLSQHVREIRTTLGRIGSMLLRLTQQFVTQDTVIRVTGKQGLDYVTVTPEDVIQEYDLVPSANSVRSNPGLLRSDVVALMEPMMTSPMVNQSAWLKHVLRVFEVPEPEEMIQDPPPPPRDPRVEERVLTLGIDVSPSPDEDFEQHMLFHTMALQQTDQNSPAYAARRKHIEQTLALQSEVMAAQMGGMGMGPAGQPGSAMPSPGGGSEARRGATMLGNAAGSVGPGGKSPGPAAPPNRRNV